jgi:hypothetical protein
MASVSAGASSVHLLAAYGPISGRTSRPWMLETNTRCPDGLADRLAGYVTQLAEAQGTASSTTRTSSRRSPG